MLRPSLIRCFFIAILLCFGAANLPAQDQQMIPPPIPAVLPPEPPDPYTLPAPTPLEWQPLVPRGEEDQSAGSVEEAAPAVQSENSIVPPPPPVTEPLLPPPDPAQAESDRADVEVWRPESISPQTPPRHSNRLAPAYVTGIAQVTLVTHFGLSAAGKGVIVRPG